MNCGRKGNKNMKGKMKYIISVLSIILVVANSSNVFAAETSAGVQNKLSVLMQGNQLWKREKRWKRY